MDTTITPHRSDMCDALGDICKHFDLWCKQNNLMYSIVQDQDDMKVMSCPDRSRSDELYDFLTPVARKSGVNVERITDQPGPVSYKFTMIAVAEGHWKAHPKTRADFSIFTKKSDAEDVRAKRTIYQRKFEDRVSACLDKIDEFQYKHPTTTYSRKQSPFRSSFAPSKTFGGVVPGKVRKEENYGAANIAGQMVPRMLEPSMHPEQGAGKTTDVHRGNSPGSKTVQPAAERQDAYDNPKTVPPSMTSPQNQPIPPPKAKVIIKKKGETRAEAFSRHLDERLSGTDDTKRSIFTGTVVPWRINQPANPVVPEFPDPESEVVPDDTETQKKRDQNPLAGSEMAQKMTYQPMGFRAGATGPGGGTWPNQMGGPHGGPVTNVRVTGLRWDQGPAVHSQQNPTMGSTSPTVPLPNNVPPGSAVKLTGPAGAVAGPVSGPIKKKKKWWKEGIDENVTRPEDGYDFLQQITRELGLPSEVRRVEFPQRKFSVVSGVDFRLEYDEIIPTQVGKLTVYRHGKKAGEIDVDLQDQAVLDSVVSKVLKMTE